MPVVKFFGYLREIAGTDKYTVNQKLTLREIFERIRKDLNDNIIGIVFKNFENFEIKDNIIVLVNGKMETNPNRQVDINDTISVMPFLSGGK